MDAQFVQLVVAVIGGGAFVKMIELFLQQRRLKREDIAKNEREAEDKKNREFESDERIVRLVIDEVAKQRDNATNRVSVLERTVAVLELEIQGLKLTAGRDPFPRWIVDNAGSYMSINPCFEETFLRPRGKTARDLIGHKHEDLWPPEFAAKLRTLDQLAKARPDGRAKATMTVEGRQITVYKLPVRHNPTGAILGYEGWITDIEPEATVL